MTTASLILALLTGTCQVQIEVRDPAEQDSVIVFGPALYLRVKEFQNDPLKAKVSLSKPIRVPERYWIVIRAKDDTAIDASDSYFDLYVDRARERLI